MTRFATQPPGKTTMHAFGGEMRVLSKENDFIYNVELALLDDRVTSNGWKYVNLEKHRKMFAKKPILIAYTRNGAKIGDGHNMKMVRGRDGKEWASFTDADSERIIGSLSDDEKDIQLIERDGHKWIVGKGTLWAFYAHEAVEKIASQGRMDISIETMVHCNKIEDGVEIEEEYTILGATILGDDVEPAVAGAYIRPLSSKAEAEFEKLRIRAASYIKKEPTDAGTPAEHADTPADNTNKGVRTGMVTTNQTKACAMFQPLFPNHRVLQVSDDGRTVLLSANQDGDVCAYTFPEDDKEHVIDSRFCGAMGEVNIVLASGAYEAKIPLTEFTAPFSRQLADASAKIAEKDQQITETQKLLSDAQEAIRVMQEKEKIRRRSDVKEKVRKEFLSINAVLSADEQIDKKTCDEIEQCADNGEYDDCTGCNGEWNGVECACAALNAACMSIVKEAKQRANAKSQSTFAWDLLKDNQGQDSDPITAAVNALK